MALKPGSHHRGGGSAGGVRIILPRRAHLTETGLTVVKKKNIGVGDGGRGARARQSGRGGRQRVIVAITVEVIAEERERESGEDRMSTLACVGRCCNP